MKSKLRYIILVCLLIFVLIFIFVLASKNKNSEFHEVSSYTSSTEDIKSSSSIIDSTVSSNDNSEIPASSAQDVSSYIEYGQDVVIDMGEEIF